jgi:hypothetical protein
MDLRASATIVQSVKLWATEHLSRIKKRSFEESLSTILNCFKWVHTKGYGSLEENVKLAVRFDQCIIPLLGVGLNFHSITVIRPKAKDCPDDWGITVYVNPFMVDRSRDVPIVASLHLKKPIKSSNFQR